MRTGIYGGSFNPVHLGHRRLADYMCRTLQLDRCLIIPAYVSPFKVNNAAVVESGHRLQMCRLAFDAPQYAVSDIEIAAQNTSYTVQTLSKLKELYPDDTFFLIIGSDMLLSFDKWHRWQDILKLCTLCAVSRCGEYTEQELTDFAESVLRKEGNVGIYPFEPLEISSTVIRAKIAAREDTSAFLHPAVAQYIRENNLYIEGTQ